jgi:hypothetical protein
VDSIVIDIRGGARNCRVTVSGFLYPDIPPTPLVLFANLEGKPKTVRLDGIIFAVQEKAGINLWWLGEDENRLILPVESRGYFNFEGVMTLPSPEGAKGIQMTTFKVDEPKSFLMMLDLVKP